MIPEEIKTSLISFFRHTFQQDLIIQRVYPLSGGSINRVYRLTTNRGELCIKYNYSSSFPGMFESESWGLRILKNASEIRIPEVITVRSSGSWSLILLEFISSSPKREDFMDDFGYSLARLHKHTEDYFGLDHDNYMGSLPQSNKKHIDWVSFFIEERLEKQLHLAKNSGYFSSGDLSRFDGLYKILEEMIPAEPPSLIHGDLWDGNYIISDEGRVCLIDPAVHYGHRETDIAMTTLFGGFDPRFYRAYNEIFPMQKGWQQRLEIYNLYPLLIHLNLFGRGYLASLRNIIRRF